MRYTEEFDNLVKQYGEEQAYALLAFAAKKGKINETKRTAFPRTIRTDPDTNRGFGDGSKIDKTFPTK